MSPVIKRPPAPLDDLLLLTEVAEITRSPLSTVRCWIAAGKISALRPGRKVLVRRSELERFLAASAK
jgi:excisionase family DNA binding protein